MNSCSLSQSLQSPAESPKPYPGTHTFLLSYFPFSCLSWYIFLASSEKKVSKRCMLVNCSLSSDLLIWDCFSHKKGRKKVFLIFLRWGMKNQRRKWSNLIPYGMRYVGSWTYINSILLLSLWFLKPEFSLPITIFQYVRTKQKLIRYYILFKNQPFVRLLICRKD